jgi:dephospho-CoA kinase
MIKIGITGGIGSGKSTVAELFRISGVPVYIADTEAKYLTNTSPIIRQALMELAGHDIYTEEGIDRKKMAALVFKDKEMLQKVNKIIHPEVNRDFKEWVQKQTSTICAIESAILFESGFDSLVDKTILVFAPEALRIKRVRSRDHISEETIRQRIKNQMSDELKMKRCNFILYNDDKKALIPQVSDLLTTLS